ncbi:MarR family transcriptional regulator [Verticiella sediminum]|uniref:MarR family transcriptional regulator n=1 Tax=Verticiella sediminum TaxID=1247510 RepID=A0A556AW30_9BURK|nr:MarR family transcriptional regulator [Verticiella sediminum]TSH97159.1 MarR family transcriptional regulator [Verticiella sediminum]
MSTPKRLSRYNPASEDFRKEEFPFYWVARLNGVYHQHMERALRKVGADVPTWRVLFILKENGTSSMSEISEHAIAKLSTITKIVYRMRAEGLVETSTSANDGRVTEVSVTEAGRQAIAAIQEATQNLFARSFRGLTPAQITKLNQLLEVLFNNLNEH